jgi:hypothetical protein
MWSSSANASKPATPLGKVGLEAAAELRFPYIRLVSANFSVFGGNARGRYWTAGIQIIT